MSALADFLANHRTGCLTNQGDVCTCGLDEARTEFEKLQEWKLAVDEACVTDWVAMTTPRETVAALISWNVKMALDPAISQAAHDLLVKVESNRDALFEHLRELANKLTDHDSGQECPFCYKTEWGKENHTTECPFGIAYDILDEQDGRK